MSIKQRILQMFCKHEWEVWTVSPTKIMCRCKKCPMVKKSKNIDWGKPVDPFKRIDWGKP